VFVQTVFTVINFETSCGVYTHSQNLCLRVSETCNLPLTQFIQQGKKILSKHKTCMRSKDQTAQSL